MSFTNPLIEITSEGIAINFGLFPAFSGITSRVVVIFAMVVGELVVVVGDVVVVFVVEIIGLSKLVADSMVLLDADTEKKLIPTIESFLPYFLENSL